ncbi:unnamed protein product [Zymoseptoria tritici ST99CH_1E4]|uniref:Uncharacterized protein n=1 Tax=Zymoseptoria tritici ST99CH_1E4 TaxID=1276532 RepID=A0A2H1G4H0_ZYMTR|nr:unnamed protein product [Zymoseptoria tritici ST99CH_1E4]
MTAQSREEQDFDTCQNQTPASNDEALSAAESNSAPGTPLEEQGAASHRPPDEDGDYQDDTLSMSSGDMTHADSLHSGDSTGGVDDPEENDVQETIAGWIDNFMNFGPHQHRYSPKHGRPLPICDYVVWNALQTAPLTPSRS